MARPTIENIRTIDPMWSNLWDVTIQLPSGVSFGSDINFRAVSSSVPKASFESQEIKIRGHKVKVAGDINYEGTITLTLVEAIDARTYKGIKQWREKIWQTKTGKGAHKKDYEATMILRRLNKEGQALITFTVKGVYLEDYTPGDMNENGEVVNVELTLSYDYFEDEVGK